MLLAVIRDPRHTPCPHGATEGRPARKPSTMLQTVNTTVCFTLNNLLVFYTFKNKMFICKNSSHIYLINLYLLSKQNDWTKTIELGLYLTNSQWQIVQYCVIS